MKRNVMDLAWKLVRKAGLTIAQALKKAWQVCLLKVKLASTDERGMWVKFQKVSGEVTTRLVTRTLEHIPGDQLPKNSRVADTMTLPVFDLLKGSWISFRADLLIAA